MRLLNLLITFSLVGILGCREATQDRTRQTVAVDSTKSSTDDPASLPAHPGNGEVVNAFDMKFVRVDIDPTVAVQSDPPFPVETYYIQQTEITADHLRSFREFAKSRNVEPRVYNDYPMSSPYEWRHYSDLARLMSEYDPDYDYRLPTKSEWVFACMSGYEQRCIPGLKDERQPNAYGLIDMLDGDVECLSEVGLLMGLWIENWPGIYDGHEMPSCACRWWTVCNPDADDSLNELIVARFILAPKKGAPSETP